MAVVYIPGTVPDKSIFLPIFETSQSTLITSVVSWIEASTLLTADRMRFIIVKQISATNTQGTVSQDDLRLGIRLQRLPGATGIVKPILCQL